MNGSLIAVRLRMARRALVWPFAAPVYRLVFKMTPRFWPYVSERDS